eukprot:3611194-Rhodomonas_salina.2
MACSCPLPLRAISTAASPISTSSPASAARSPSRLAICSADACMSAALSGCRKRVYARPSQRAALPLRAMSCSASAARSSRAVRRHHARSRRLGLTEHAGSPPGLAACSALPQAFQRSVTWLPACASLALPGRPPLDSQPRAPTLSRARAPRPLAPAPRAVRSLARTRHTPRAHRCCSAQSPTAAFPSRSHAAPDPPPASRRPASHTPARCYPRRARPLQLPARC